MCNSSLLFGDQISWTIQVIRGTVTTLSSVDTLTQAEANT